MTGDAFDDLTDIYDAMIDWPKRLAREEPFYRALFARTGVQRIVDVACGTGRHAAMFHSWGLEVTGADLSPAMVERARARFGEPPGLRWLVRSFDQPFDAGASAGAAVCVGNSMALAPNLALVNEALRQMLAGVRAGGVVVVQVLNVWALPDGPCVWQKSVQVALQGGPCLIIKGVHRCADRAYVELLVSPLEGDRKLRSESVPFLGLEATELGRMAQACGAARASFFGGYQNQPYDRTKSADLIMVAEK